MLVSQNNNNKQNKHVKHNVMQFIYNQHQLKQWRELSIRYFFKFLYQSSFGRYTIDEIQNHQEPYNSFFFITFYFYEE